jgi:hypothetical protein
VGTRVGLDTGEEEEKTFTLSKYEKFCSQLSLGHMGFRDKKD